MIVQKCAYLCFVLQQKCVHWKLARLLIYWPASENPQPGPLCSFSPGMVQNLGNISQPEEQLKHFCYRFVYKLFTAHMHTRKRERRAQNAHFSTWFSNCETSLMHWIPWTEAKLTFAFLSFSFMQQIWRTLP